MPFYQQNQDGGTSEFSEDSGERCYQARTFHPRGALHQGGTTKSQWARRGTRQSSTNILISNLFYTLRVLFNFDIYIFS